MRWPLAGDRLAVQARGDAVVDRVVAGPARRSAATRCPWSRPGTSGRSPRCSCRRCRRPRARGRGSTPGGCGRPGACRRSPSANAVGAWPLGGRRSRPSPRGSAARGRRCCGPRAASSSAGRWSARRERGVDDLERELALWLVGVLALAAAAGEGESERGYDAAQLPHGGRAYHRVSDRSASSA